MTQDDDQLFSMLERAIGPTAADTPTDAERQHLRAAVDDWRQHRPIPITAARSRRWLRRTIATGLGTVVVLSGATAVAAAVNDGVLPAPARSVARTIGLPVESADMAKARAALGRVRKADESDLNEMELALEAAMNRLTASEHAKIDAAAAAALLEAHALDEQASANSGSGSSGSGSGSDSGSSGSNSGPSGSSGSGSDSSGSSGSGSSGSSDSGSSGSGSSGSGGSGSSGSGSGGSGSSGSGSGGSGEASTTSTTGHVAVEDHGDSTTTSTTNDESREGQSHGGDSSTSTTSNSGNSGPSGGGGDD